MFYVVPTPIGNLEDITLRALKYLSQSQYIFCEDTRITSKLLDLLKIRQNQKLISSLKNSKFNHSQIFKLLQEYKKDPTETWCLVCDAGTPSLSDPGYEVIQLLLELEVDFSCLPGANAFLPALVSSGLPMHEFTFLGFLPLKKGRQTSLNKIATSSQKTFVLYESSHRLEKLCGELQLHLAPNTKICIVKELSKQFEHIWRGTTAELNLYSEVIKGEFVVIIHT
jgi:16S rRNA (cytidine1402-2'-O)-methyltransferase